MNRSPAQVRQIIYGLIILGLFIVKFPYSEKLKQIKEEKDLGEATIGQIDTGSFLVKLALLGGFRGVVTNWLWMNALGLQKVHEWDRLDATVNMITKLQPHFQMVWTWQGWNLAYNVSVEWDAPEDKYEWIKKGTKFLQEGVRKNRKSPDLVYDTGWNYYNKIGFSDEAIIFRRLFRDDPDVPFKTDPDSEGVRSDNFLVAHGWFVNSIKRSETEERLATTTESPTDYVDKPVQRKGRPDDMHFRVMPAHAQTRYADRLEKASIQGVPATFGQIARVEWEKADREWTEIGNYAFPMHEHPEVKIYLIHSLDPTALAKLPKGQRYWTRRWADDTNYRFWKDRATAEKEPDAVRARHDFYDATRAFKAADFPKAVENYRAGLAIWEALLKRHPYYRDDDLNKKDTGLIVKRYVAALTQAGLEEPKDLPFADLLKAAQDDEALDIYDAQEMLTPTLATEPTRGQ